MLADRCGDLGHQCVDFGAFEVGDDRFEYRCPAGVAAHPHPPVTAHRALLRGRGFVAVVGEPQSPQPQSQ
ncbi:hypothetical protein CH282_02745 [Rhodococcus sp. 06-418-1B]|nr:hypothetical protein CH282_02745 [Rhodococcus sp. 06-418-1B]